MKLQFSLEYRTDWGDNVAVELSLTKVKGQKTVQIHNLDTKDGLHWFGEVSSTDRDIISFEYRYCIVNKGTVVRREWNGVPRKFNADVTRTFIFPDYWKNIPILSHLYSSAYTNTVCPWEIQQPELFYYDHTLVFRVQAPQLKPGQRLALLGSQPPLGFWNPSLALPMQKCGIYEWCISISATGLQFPFEYKYVVMDEKTNELVEWESGDNRVSPFRGVDLNQVLVCYDQRVRLLEEHWKAAGVVVPVFSLRSEGSQGVGDFGDLKMMVDWAVETGMHVIQLLPIYDTTQSHKWTDSYPYNSISIYALHPMYVDLRKLPAIDDAEFMAIYESTRQKLNDLPQMDYALANDLKWAYLRASYMQQGAEVFATSDFKIFYEKNAERLLPYAAYCYLRDKNGTSNFREWPEHSTFDRKDIAQLCASEANYPGEIGFHIYIQYLLDLQLSEVSAYARKNGVVLKGDIPIGISTCSVEAWIEPYYFHMNGQAGAPPDAFSVNGQNWGFPTYDWDRMAQDDYQWWKRRFKKMSEYFDAYRIDHVLGFFRIWEIPLHSVHGLLGHFSPSLPMSVEEIETKWGLKFRKEYFTKPLITDSILDEIFGNDLSFQIKTVYLDKIGRDWYEMKPEFDTQRKICAKMWNKTEERDVKIREGLYQLISNVLFIEDEQAPGTYHPRINAIDDFVYQSLSSGEQESFSKLYEHYYYVRHNDFWYKEAKKKLPALVESTHMLACAEDLGMVPSCVAPVMNELRMLSLEIQAMPKAFGVRFGNIQQNPYRSVATIFTHDMETLRGWWEEDMERSQQYYNEVLQKDGKAPSTMPGWLCEEVIARHLYSPSMLCLISIQDWMSMDESLRYSDPAQERINIPANPRHYWRYRMHLPIETLISSKDFNAKIKEMIKRSSR